MSFACVALPFLVQPDATHWTQGAVLFVHMSEGFGRATFEGTLRARYADYFGYEPEGAFATISLQNGLSTTVGYILSMGLPCSASSSSSSLILVSRYCIPYQDESHHNILLVCTVLVGTSIAAIVGLRQAARIGGPSTHPTTSRRTYDTLSSSNTSAVNEEESNAGDIALREMT